MGKIQAKSIFRLVPIIGDLGRFLLAFTLNCLPVTESGPFRRLTAAVTLCSAAFLFWLFIFQQPLFLRWVSAFFLCFCFSDASPTIYSEGREMV